MRITRSGTNGAPVEKLDVSVYTVLTDAREADGMLSWNKTMLVLVEISAGGKQGRGYSYADVRIYTAFPAVSATLSIVPFIPFAYGKQRRRKR